MHFGLVKVENTYHERTSTIVNRNVRYKNQKNFKAFILGCNSMLRPH